MKKHLTLILSLLVLAATASAQNSTNPKETFEKIFKAVKEYKPDTSAVPDDKITRKIAELRSLRGGFNINGALEYKIEEDRQKNEVPKQELDKISEFFKTGDGKRWLENAVTWIYRKQFTYKELKKLVKFYKTSAGQKMANDLPVIMLQSFTAAEQLKEIYIKQQKK